MGKYKHHSGAIGGGVNLSKGKTPHDSLMKYMPIDDKASGLFKMAKPFKMGVSMRGSLDKHGMHKGPDMHGKKHDGPSKYMDHKGPNKMDPMYNGKPGVQKEDFEQFKSPNEMGYKSKGPDKKGQPLHQQELDANKKQLAKGAKESASEKSAKRKLMKHGNKKMTKKVTAKPQIPVSRSYVAPRRKERVQAFRVNKVSKI